MIYRDSGFLSVEQAARQKDMTPQGIRKAIKEGRIDAYVVGKQWAIKPKDIEKFIRRSRCY